MSPDTAIIIYSLKPCRGAFRASSVCQKSLNQAWNSNIGFPKGSHPFGQVKGWQPLWGVGQSPTYSLKTLRKGWIQKQSGGLFLERGRPAREGVPLRQHRTKHTWRLCTESACIFSVILHRNPLTYVSMPAKFLYNLTKNLSAHLQHNLCAVLPILYTIQ